MSRAGKSGGRDRWGAIRIALVGLVASASAGFLVVVFLVNLLTLRRQRRRLEHVRRELCLDEGAQDSPEAGRAGGAHS